MAKKSASVATTSEPKIVTIERDIPNPYDNRRIYAVVAESVLHPLTKVEVPENLLFNNKTVIGPRQSFYTLKPTEDTRRIHQVPGRIAAQAAHAVSKVRHYMIRDEVFRADRVARKLKSSEHWFKSDMLFFFPITTIILSCRDSYELNHIKNLLYYKTDVLFKTFKDTNPEVYGAGEVLTALATMPTTPEQVMGILDYLPLWTPLEKPVPRPI
jgi:hypothetical protein